MIVQLIFAIPLIMRAYFSYKNLLIKNFYFLYNKDTIENKLNHATKEGLEEKYKDL